MSIDTYVIGNSRMVFHGSVGAFVMDDIMNDKLMDAVISQGKVVVGIGRPKASAIKIKDSGDVDASDLIADRASLSVAGWGALQHSSAPRCVRHRAATRRTATTVSPTQAKPDSDKGAST